MDFETAAALSFYEQIASLNASQTVLIVKHRESQRIYIEKILQVYHRPIYETLKEDPVPGTPRIYDLFQDGDRLIVIEEYVFGQTLAEILECEHQLSEARVTKYTQELCRILLCLHNMKPPIIHRDIKPENIMVRPDDRILLAILALISIMIFLGIMVEMFAKRFGI